MSEETGFVIAFCTLFGLTGLIFTAFGVLSYRSRIRLYRTGKTVTGEVVEVLEKRKSRTIHTGSGIGSYQIHVPVIAYKVHGKTYRHEGDMGYREARHEVGDGHEIVYDPSYPSRACVKNAYLTRTPLYFATAGIVCLMLAVAMPFIYGGPAA